jgi:HlyD family type I secretion membrane fusion protein
MTMLPPACRKPAPDRHVLALEEIRPRALERWLILGAAALVFGFLGWAHVTRLPEISIAQGEVSTVLAAAPVQHLEGGIVEAVLVREGEAVAEGQPLLRMHDTVARAELGQLATRRAVLELQRERLLAVAEGRAMPAAEGPHAGPQRAALESRLAVLADRLATLTEHVGQRRAEVVSLEAQAQAVARQLVMFQDELATRQGLARDGLTTRIAVLEAQRMALGAAADQERLTNQAVAARRALAEAEARLVELRSQAVDEARQESARVSLELAETQETMARLQDRAERTVLRAPSAGVVRGLAVHRPGSVLQPGQLIAEVLPSDAALVVDARIAPRDIGFVAVGQRVEVKVQAFDFSRFGTVRGVVERISAGSFMDEQRQPYYRARVALDQEHVGRNPGLARLAAGMTVQADITTGSKTVMQYLLKPIYASVATAFSER